MHLYLLYFFSIPAHCASIDIIVVVMTLCQENLEGLTERL